MADAQKQLLRMLAENGYTLVRHKKHQVFRGPDGRIFVLPSTGSDCRSPRAALSDFRRHLGEPARATTAILEKTAIENEIVRQTNKSEPRLPIARRGKRSKGTGIRIVEKIVKVPTVEERAASLAAAAAEQTAATLARQRRKDQYEHVASCIAFARRGADRLYEKSQRAISHIVTNREKFIRKFRNSADWAEVIDGMSDSEVLAAELISEIHDLNPRNTIEEIVHAFRGTTFKRDDIFYDFVQAAKQYIELGARSDRVESILAVKEFVNSMKEWHASMAIVKYEPPLYSAKQIHLPKAA